MNPYDELELNREEGRNLLDRLTRLTEQQKIVWTCTKYTPLFLFRNEDDDPIELMELSQDFTAVTRFGGGTVTAFANEVLRLSGRGRPELTLTFSADGSDPQTIFDGFPRTNITLFLDTMLPGIIDSEVISSICDGWVSPFLYEKPEITERPISRLCERLYQERRHMDFHNAVCHPQMLKALLTEIS